jgi:hypothetical protein
MHKPKTSFIIIFSHQVITSNSSSIKLYPNILLCNVKDETEIIKICMNRIRSMQNNVIYLQNDGHAIYIYTHIHYRIMLQLL